MKGFLAVARREIGERKLIFVAATFASLMPLAVPILDHLGAPNAAGARGWTALIISAAFVLGLSVALGASLIVAPMATRRIGFDFARPLSAVAIWGGRLTAAVTLVAATALIIWTPAWLAGARFEWKELMIGDPPPGAWPVWVGILVVALFSLFHALALMFRSRSAMLALDAAMALAVSLGVWVALSRLPFPGAAGPLVRIALCFVSAAILALLVAGCLSVARGRTEIKVAHRSLSLALWSVLSIAVLGAIGYSVWVMAARPTDLEGSLWATPAANGPWIEVGGSARGAEATFLYDVTSGRSARTVTRDWRGPVFSSDGTRAAWIPTDAYAGPFPVWTWRLDDPRAQPLRTLILMNQYPSLLELSADGTRLATMEAEILSIHDLASDKTLASARIPSTDRQAVRGLFIGHDRFRIYRSDAAALDILELDTASRTLANLGKVTGFEELRYVVLDPTGSRVIVSDAPSRRVRLFDGRSGEFLATLADTPADGRWPRFLSGGRIVVTERSSAGLRLLLFGAEGKAGATIALPPGRQATAGGEVKPGMLVVSIADEKFDYTSWLVDLDAPSIRKVADHLRPVRSLWTSVDAGSNATRLFYGPGQRSLVYLDALTGERKVLLGTGP